jgi:hypothetical protein
MDMTMSSARPDRVEVVIQVKQAIADVVNKRATYGYRRVWARLRLDGYVEASTTSVFTAS